MSLFEKLSTAAKRELIKEAGIFDSLEDIQRSLHLMSTEDLQILEEKIQKIINEHKKQVMNKDLPYESTPLEEFDFCDDISSLAHLADSFDKMGYFKAADIIDELSERLTKKISQPGRIYAKLLRQIKKIAKTPDWMPAPLTQQQIPSAMTSQQVAQPYQPQQQPGIDTSGLTQEQINRVNRIQNPGLKSQWISELKRRNMMARQPVQQPAPRTQPIQSQPVQLQPVQPQPTQIAPKKPFNIDEHMRAVSGQPTAEDDEIRKVYEGAEIKADD